MTEVMQLIVESRTRETDAIQSFVLTSPSHALLPQFTAGSHVDVHLPNGQIRQYSLSNNPSDRSKYVLGVLKDMQGKGGSVLMHEHIQVNTKLTVSLPRNNFPLVVSAKNNLLLAGGIGITPLLAMCHHLHATEQNFTLHYCTRSSDQTAFLNLLENSGFADNVVFHHDFGDPTKGLDIAALLQSCPNGTHIYCCGPISFMSTVKNSSKHWPNKNVHFEHFQADNTEHLSADSAFEIELASSGKRYVVPADKSILDVLSEAGHHVDYSCREGVCGSCITGVLDGIPDHRDQVLDQEEKQAGDIMTVCCSRSMSPILKLDL